MRITGKWQKTILGALLLVPFLLNAGQGGKISGIITDAQNGDVYPDANVLLTIRWMGVLTDFNYSQFSRENDISPRIWSLSMGWGKISRCNCQTYGKFSRFEFHTYGKSISIHKRTAS